MLTCDRMVATAQAGTRLSMLRMMARRRDFSRLQRYLAQSELRIPQQVLPHLEAQIALFVMV